MTAFGVANASGTINASPETDQQGRPVYVQQTGAGFIVFIEGRPGPSRLRIGTDLFNSRANDPARQPDLQIESSHDLGDGSAAVCDNSLGMLGGVPATNPPDFRVLQTVSDALNDLSCRFKAFGETAFACTQDGSGNFVFGNVSSTVQFCSLVNDALTFPSGDTVLTARLLDTAGEGGPAAQIVIRVTETP